VVILSYLLVGLVSGMASGFLGIGGGAIMIPALVFLFGLTQHQAQGTTLAVLLPPVFLLAVWKYYSAGNVHVKMALIIAVGFVVGTYFGANFAQTVPDENLRKFFGVFLVIIGIRMFL